MRPSRFFLAVLALIAASSFAACGTPSTVVPSQGAQSVSEGAQRGDALTPCKGQKNKTKYASLGPKALLAKGGLLCVPLYKGWGGTMTYPNVETAGVTASLISSTTEYSPPLWPPVGSVKPIFLIQFTVNNDRVAFGTKIPKGGALVWKDLVVKHTYSIYSALQSFGSLWQNEGACYTVAFKTKDGPAITGLATAMAGHGFQAAGTRLVIEILPGKLYSNHC